MNKKRQKLKKRVERSWRLRSVVPVEWSLADKGRNYAPFYKYEWVKDLVKISPWSLIRAKHFEDCRTEVEVMNRFYLLPRESFVDGCPRRCGKSDCWHL